MSVNQAIDSKTRLDELDRCDVLDTPDEEAFDRITRLVCNVFNVRMSTVTFIDGHRQWFKSRQGIEMKETSREFSFCRMTVAEARPIVIEDVTQHAETRHNPFVTGEPGVRFYAGVPLRGEAGQVIGTLCAVDTAPRRFSAANLDTLSDLAHLLETEMKLRLLAMTDGLTEALSRRAFLLQLEKAAALAVRHRHDLSCIVFDLDHFKAINDRSGHRAGDLVLAKVGEICRGALRASDPFGRIGGEEFAIALPHTNLRQALGVADKLRRALHARTVESDASDAATASFGVAALTAGVADAVSLLERADQAMYQAKANGRNCCVVWEGNDDGAVARRVLKAGNIVFNQGRSVIDCTVRKLSDKGASLAVVSAEGVPKRFKLNIAADDFSRACSVVGKSGQRLEVTFG